MIGLFVGLLGDYDKLRTEGSVDLSAYNTRENAADVECAQRAARGGRSGCQLHPNLLLSGEFDPGTPPALAEIAATTLSHHYSYVFPSMGHTDGFLSRCWSSIESQFLDDPEHAPDSSCIGNMADAVFVVD